MFPFVWQSFVKVLFFSDQIFKRSCTKPNNIFFKKRQNPKCKKWSRTKSLSKPLICFICFCKPFLSYSKWKFWSSRKLMCPNSGGKSIFYPFLVDTSNLLSCYILSKHLKRKTYNLSPSLHWEQTYTNGIQKI